MKNLFKLKPQKNMSFDLYRFKLNLNSCLVLAIIDFLSCIFFITFIDLDYNIGVYLTIGYLFLWIISYLIYYNVTNRESVFTNRLFFISYLFPTLVLHTLMFLLSNLSIPTLGVYSIFILFNCVFFSITLLENILIYIPLAIIFVFNLLLKYPQGVVLNTLLFNIVLTNLLAFVYSVIKYNSSKKTYQTYMILLDTIDDRDESNEKLKAHEKYITDFFINISHDLKAPLNIIYSSEQLLEKQITQRNMDYNKAEKYITSIKLNSIRLTRLLNNVLDISKIDAAKFSLNLRNLDLVTTIEGITDSLLDFMSSKNITLSFDTNFEEMILALDEEKLERIILNLLSNALKFTPSGGKITISLYDNIDFVFVSIKDTGMGIDEETQKNIFDRFVQGTPVPSNEMSGSGIGLSLVKSLMQLHGGDVFLESQIGNGCNFILKFKKYNIVETLKEDIANGSIYPNCSSSTATHLEFGGLIKQDSSNNTSA